MTVTELQDSEREEVYRSLRSVARRYLTHEEGPPLLPDDRPEIRHTWTVGFARGIDCALFAYPPAEVLELTGELLDLCGCDNCRHTARS